MGSADVGSLMSLPMPGMLTCPCLRHDHNVLKLQVVFEFGLVFDREATVLGAFNQFRYAPLDTVGRAEGHHGLWSRTGGDEIDNFILRFGYTHGSSGAAVLVG